MQESSDLTEHLLEKGRDEDAPSGDLDMSKIFNNEYNTSAHASEQYFKANCKSVENMAKIFRTDLANGLNSSNKEDLKWREDKWGNNHLPPEKENSILAHIIECFEDPTLRVLLVASIVSLIIGVAKDGIKTGWIEGTAIFFAVFLVVSISSYMNYQETEQFLKLSRETKLKKVLVIRDGREKEISIEDVLVGDVLKLRIGDIINVDGFVFGDAKAGMDESPVTGESDVMWKVNDFEQKGQKYTCPFVFSGSQVVDGYGNMIVAAVGDKTFEGANKQLINSTGGKSDDDDDEDANLTPLKKQLNELSNLIGDLGYLMAILIGCVLFLKETIINIVNGISIFTSHELDVIVNAFIIAVTVIVVAIPEGLPMAVTIALAYSVDKMKREHNLVKHLDKSEAMGNVNNVCTDKTGTLTLGVMRVCAFYIEGQDIKLSNNKINDQDLRDLIWRCIYKNITCVETVDDKGNKVLNGDMTEKALYTYLNEGQYPLEGNRKGLYVLPFKSDYKYMMNIYKENDDYILYAKGAPERVGEFFTKFRVAGGREEDYEEHKQELFDKQAEYAEDSMRTLIFGYKKVTEEEIQKAKDAHPDDDLGFFQELAKGLCFAFMVGIRDNNREDVPQAIEKCHHAGITVRMVTGDNINTAIAISKDVGIIEPSQAAECKRLAAYYREQVQKNEDAKNGIRNGENPIALEGEIFRVICGGITKKQGENGDLEIFLNNREAFKHTVKELKVIARASPEDKFILVFGLKELGNIVAVTGDGTNDAPALRQAHVGFAMGIRGTDIAKDAADVVLLDDSFSSIVTACKYGRNVYDCIRKFVQFQLTTNIVAVFMTFLGGIILKDSPLNAIQMLWVNLIMDSFASLALATEDPNDSLLDRKPYSRDASILTPMMKLNIVSQAIFQISTLTIIIFYGDYIFGVPSDRNLEHFMWNNVNGYHFTIFFNIFVFMQVFNSINARKLQKDEYNVFTGIMGNWLYILIQSIIIIGQIILVTFGGRAVRTHPLSIKQHCDCLGISALTLVWGFIVKLLPIDVTEPTTVGEEQVKTPDTYKKTVGLGYMSRGQMRMNSGVRGLNSSSSRVKK
ncbi:MAG: cation-translocating P-type ATPase [Clostridia bacterium]|nr:cation-translocating P-type ATPase [Clostridia bacterium]